MQAQTHKHKHTGGVCWLLAYHGNHPGESWTVCLEIRMYQHCLPTPRICPGCESFSHPTSLSSLVKLAGRRIQLPASWMSQGFKPGPWILLTSTLVPQADSQVESHFLSAVMTKAIREAVPARLSTSTLISLSGSLLLSVGMTKAMRDTMQ